MENGLQQWTPSRLSVRFLSAYQPPRINTKIPNWPGHIATWLSRDGEWGRARKVISGGTLGHIRAGKWQNGSPLCVRVSRYFQGAESRLPDPLISGPILSFETSTFLISHTDSEPAGRSCGNSSPPVRILPRLKEAFTDCTQGPAISRLLSLQKFSNKLQVNCDTPENGLLCAFSLRKSFPGRVYKGQLLSASSLSTPGSPSSETPQPLAGFSKALWDPLWDCPWGQLQGTGLALEPHPLSDSHITGGEQMSKILHFRIMFTFL